MRTILITGGCGFIGSNAAARFAADGWRVIVLDNLARRGAAANLAWLQKMPGVTFVRADIRDVDAVRTTVRQAGALDAVIHLAAQVAVTTSVADPRGDFEVNALGTLNVLEAMRETKSDALLIYASTNKVYGGMEDVAVVEQGGRYGYRDYPEGMSEARPLDFHSPYGCSKGAADQYVRDYARIYGLRSVVLRKSCIYGYRQFGIEDQGWIAWFIIATLLDRPLTIYGDGMQVRDVLFVDDLVDLYERLIEKADVVSGHIFNIGGGAANRLSLLDLLRILERLAGRPLQPALGDWRPGDQRVYVSDIGLVRGVLGWTPRVSATEGVERLYRWAVAHKGMFAEVFGG